MTYRGLILISFLAAQVMAKPALAVPTAIISPESNNGYVIELQNCLKLRSIELVVDYPLGLGNPGISPGGIGAAQNLNVTQSVSMLRLDLSAKKAFLPYGGILAYINFPQAQDNPQPVNMSGWAVGMDGTRTELDAWYQGPNNPPKDPVAEPDSDGTGSGGADLEANAPVQPQKETPRPSGGGEPERAQSTGVSSGNSGRENRVSTPEGEAPNPPFQGTAARAVALDPGADGKPLPPVEQFPGVLDRFREFQGDRTESALRHLFDADPAAHFHQEPAVGIADGKTPVTIIFDLAAPGDEVGFLSLSNIRMVSFQYLDGGTKAQIAVVPKGEGYNSCLTVKSRDRIFAYPLTVAPPLDPGLSAAGVIGGKLVRRDYNGDGTADYLDDYILMVNRLARESQAPGRNGKLVSPAVAER